MVVSDEIAVSSKILDPFARGKLTGTLDGAGLMTSVHSWAFGQFHYDSAQRRLIMRDVQQRWAYEWPCPVGRKSQDAWLAGYNGQFYSYRWSEDGKNFLRRQTRAQKRSMAELADLPRFDFDEECRVGLAVSRVVRKDRPDMGRVWLLGTVTNYRTFGEPITIMPSYRGVLPDATADPAREQAVTLNTWYRAAYQGEPVRKERFDRAAHQHAFDNACRKLALTILDYRKHLQAIADQMSDELGETIPRTTLASRLDARKLQFPQLTKN